MAKTLNIIGYVLSALGVIAGIIFAITTGSFALLIYVWIGTFLTVVIYFALARIITNQIIINDKLNKLLGISDTKETNDNILKGTKTTDTENSASNKNQTFSNEKAKAIPVSSEKITCPNCGFEQPNNRTVCWKCGTHFISQ